MAVKLRGSGDRRTPVLGSRVPTGTHVCAQLLVYKMLRLLRCERIIFSADEGGTVRSTYLCCFWWLIESSFLLASVVVGHSQIRLS